ncbi:TPR repeat-containing protein [Brachionus plicatilis]|uniref:TPR repeat-containing protein n=1 Tax=Brachionus plicatilis TaxID=10195 RepID=A0A3M7QNS6_BRAPC|nr:TPR repeat-containing protein [Brachionus plicatilis]
MFSNINPYVCCNQDEFRDEINFLRDITFPKLRERLIRLNVNFDPVLIDWTESNDLVRSGGLLRLLLTAIRKSSPFFIGLLGHQYGPHLTDSQANTLMFSDSSVRLEMNWLEKSYVIAAQTGFSSVINEQTFNNGLLEHQINQALHDSKAYPFYRFYFRQFEYFEDLYSHLPIEKRKAELRKHEAESDLCDTKIKHLKMKLAKKGLIIKYYKSLEQLNDLIYDDFIEIIRVCSRSVESLSRKRYRCPRASLAREALEWTTLEERRRRGDLIKLHKIQHDQVTFIYGDQELASYGLDSPTDNTRTCHKAIERLWSATQLFYKPYCGILWTRRLSV